MKTNIAKNKTFLTAALALACVSSAQASENSPFLQAQGTGNVSFSFGHQEADEFTVGDTEMMLPTDLELDTVTLFFSHGLTDRLTFDLQVGQAESDFLVDAGLAPQGGLDGTTDSRLGLRFGIFDDGASALAIRGTGIIDGGYRTGAITAIGDGGSGFEFALLGGHAFESGFTLTGDLGWRNRGNGVPNESFGSINGYFQFNEAFGAFGGYQVVRSDGDLDIGGPGFSPARFPELDEDYEALSGGGYFSFDENWGAGLSIGRKLDGRNTALSDFWNIFVSYNY